MDEPTHVVVFCPRCDRSYSGKKYEETLEETKRHVALQHPDHNPDWAEKD